MGVAQALGFEIVEVSPQTWKKGFEYLPKGEIDELKKQIKDMKAKGGDKKVINKIEKEVKELGKSAALEYVAGKYPDLADRLKYNNSDGLAESVIIALYGQTK